ncbi:MAG: hypothetical protein AAFR61_09945 [Bacteroidota bacterium]
MRFFYLFLLFMGTLSFGSQTLVANDCASAIDLLISPPGVPYTCTTPASGVFSGTCTGVPQSTYLTNLSLAFAGFPNNCNAIGCSQDLWFKFEAGDPSQQYNMEFEISIDFTTTTTSVVQYFLVYSESKDGSGAAIPACEWSNSINNDHNAFSNRVRNCFTVTGGTTSNFTISAEGLDGEGTYFLVFERESGTGGSVQVCSRTNSTTPTCLAPANDRCSNAIALTVGSGIDALYASGGSNTWGDALCGTNACATKERIQGECSLGSETEDHWYRSAFLFGCNPILHYGDVLVPLTNIKSSTCVAEVDKTVFFTFTLPTNVSGSGWYVHVGNTQCPGEMGANTFKLSLVSNMTCTSAEDYNLLSCLEPSQTLTYPSADLEVALPALVPGNTYGLIAEGTRGSGCSFKIQLDRLPVVNPPLPVEIETFSGENRGYQNQLQWKTDWERNLDRFEVERSLNGIDFQPLGTQLSYGDSPDPQQYYFTDQAAPFGYAYYRLKAYDIDGTFSYSDQIQVERAEAGLEIHQVSASAERNSLRINLSAPGEEDLQMELLDLAGRRLAFQSLAAFHGAQTYTLATPGIAQGHYLLRVRQGKQVRLFRVSI